MGGGGSCVFGDGKETLFQLYFDAISLGGGKFEISGRG